MFKLSNLFAQQLAVDIMIKLYEDGVPRHLAGIGFQNKDFSEAPIILFQYVGERTTNVYTVSVDEVEALKNGTIGYSELSDMQLLEVVDSHLLVAILTHEQAMPDQPMVRYQHYALLN